jgi:glyoxylase-like metal-dependent hydrolase (beta-lactamase superfamily II)
MPAHTIINAGYRSTNYWVVGGTGGRLLVDIGWPGSMGAMGAALRRLGVPLDELRYAFATHYHMDHAGLGEELKRAGVPLLVADVQVDAIDAMARHMKPTDRYVPITPAGNVVVGCDASRALLATIGIAGTLVHTPGHTDHCVSLLLDDGAVFTGDLTAQSVTDDGTTLASWQTLRTLGARTVHPGHGPAYPMPDAVC